MTTEEMAKTLAGALESVKVEVTKYTPDKVKCIHSTMGKAMTVEKFFEGLSERLGKSLMNYPCVFEASLDQRDARNLIEAYAEYHELSGEEDMPPIPLPHYMEKLQLNIDLSANGKANKFFLTNEKERVSDISGEVYMLIMKMSPMDAAAAARKVLPVYRPRADGGVSMDEDGRLNLNTYIPPIWHKHERWNHVYHKPPKLFIKLCRHLFPILEEREYFYSWLHDSLFTRAYVYLILCGDPGIGKNRLKLVMRALHGFHNSIDGKKSTLTERFNSQLSDATLAWFDELRFDVDMENTMKELQNDSISIERKGIDATRMTKIHASLVISNNKPRDNYIAFDARKFVPLVLTKKRLEESMTSEEIDQITQMTEDPTSETFNASFIVQIAKWLKTRGPGPGKRWPHLEYKGPMFWTLAHTSMSKWQKKAVTVVMDKTMHNPMMGYDEKQNRFQWSIVHDKALKRSQDRSLTFPDYTSVRAFFDIFRDSKGRKAFETESIGKTEDVMGDFFVRPLFKETIITTEASLNIGKDATNGKEKAKPFLDDGT